MAKPYKLDGGELGITRGSDGKFQAASNVQAPRQELPKNPLTDESPEDNKDSEMSGWAPGIAQSTTDDTDGSKIPWSKVTPEASTKGSGFKVS